VVASLVAAVVAAVCYGVASVMQAVAVRAASQAGREHPSRILAVITRRPKGESRLDAEIRVGETGPGETILLRMYGPLGQHADSVVAPLLAPDVPVVTWWPDEAPSAPSGDPLGAVAQRRVTDAAASETPKDMLLTLAKAYKPGDTDLSWTRATSSSARRWISASSGSSSE